MLGCNIGHASKEGNVDMTMTIPRVAIRSLDYLAVSPTEAE